MMIVIIFYSIYFANEPRWVYDWIIITMKTLFDFPFSLDKNRLEGGNEFPVSKNDPSSFNSDDATVTCLSFWLD